MTMIFSEFLSEMRVCECTSSEQKESLCKGLIENLPDWFQLPESNRHYIQDAGRYPALVAACDAQNVGLLVYRELEDDVLKKNVMNIHWLGVLPAYHGRGVGRALLSFLEGMAPLKTITVETLDPLAKDEHYLKTYAFYEKMGFKTYHRFAFRRRQ